jgi:hypothetical protein
MAVPKCLPDGLTEEMVLDLDGGPCEDSYKTESCTICLENLETENVIKWGCNHAYHVVCARRQILTSSTILCPLCRYEPRVIPGASLQCVLEQRKD